MNISKKKKRYHKACGKKKSCSTQLFFTLQKTHLGKILLKAAKQPVLMTNILGKQKLHMFSFYSTKNKEETKSFLNLSVTFPYARRQTMSKLNLDINGSKQQNAGPWRSNYSLFRGYASKKLHKFPVRITFLQVVAMFLSKAIRSVFAEELSSPLRLPVHSPAQRFRGAQRRGGVSAERLLQAQPEPAPGLCPAGFRASPRADSTTPVSNLFQCLTTLTQKVSSHV